MSEGVDGGIATLGNFLYFPPFAALPMAEEYLPPFYVSKRSHAPPCQLANILGSS